MKRGAMLALGFSSIAYACIPAAVPYSARAGSNARAAAGAWRGELGVLVYNWDAVKTRFEDTSGSGRDKMYAMLVEHWTKAEPRKVVFGFGINSVQRYARSMFGSENDSGTYAHSDWFQLMHDFGLLGIGLLAWLHAAVLGVIRRGFKMRDSVAPSLAMGYIILFLVNIYSGHLLAPGAIYFGLLIAYADSALQKKAPPVYLSRIPICTGLPER